jgi:dephospho-CoA kinase/inosine/xanthosine triphosphate pyrophosphatase family protein
MTRLGPERRAIFANGARLPAVYFYTSNSDKFLQARLMFERAGLSLLQFKSRTEPYAEDYSAGKEVLLDKALAQILANVGMAVPLFVEDTSLRLNALSSTEEDYPGLRVKEWFDGTSFHELDGELTAHGDDRSCCVKSDIALHVPGIESPLYFHGETSGFVPSKFEPFAGDPVHPWLTARTFNGWFIPDGATVPLGAMDLEQSLSFDFRARSLRSLIDTIETLAAGLNLPPAAYRVPLVRAPDQLGLFGGRARLTVAVGFPGAGKTTLGEYLAARRDVLFIEASDVMRELGERYRRESLDGSALARRVVNDQGADAIAIRALELASKAEGRPVVITGFRLVEEIEYVIEHEPDVIVLNIEASERVRLERHLRRGRPGAPRSLEELKELDAEQAGFGLLPVSRSLAHASITNEGSYDEFYASIDALSAAIPVDKPGRRLAGVRSKDTAQLFRALTALEEIGRAASTDEVQRGTATTGPEIRQNNVNKVLKRVPSLARRLTADDTRVRYVITDSGRAYLRLLRADVALN